MDGTSAAMKVIKQISPTQEENRKAMNDNKTNSRSPIEADKNKGHSLIKQRHYEI